MIIPIEMSNKKLGLYYAEHTRTYNCNLYALWPGNDSWWVYNGYILFHSFLWVLHATQGHELGNIGFMLFARGLEQMTVW